MILVRCPTFICVDILWLIPNNFHFICFCFTYFSSTPHLHSQFAYYRGRGSLFLLLKFLKILQVLANIPLTQNTSEKSSPLIL